MVTERFRCSAEVALWVENYWTVHWAMPDGVSLTSQVVPHPTLADRSVVTLTELGRRHGLTVRALQRLFRHYIGVGPKWVLARYRMHDVLSDLDAGYDGSLTDLAHRYGWYDQAHFNRDFAAATGVTPGDYLRPTPDRS